MAINFLVCLFRRTIVPAVSAVFAPVSLSRAQKTPWKVLLIQQAFQGWSSPISFSLFFRSRLPGGDAALFRFLTTFFSFFPFFCCIDNSNFEWFMLELFAKKCLLSEKASCTVTMAFPFSITEPRALFRLCGADTVLCVGHATIVSFLCGFRPMAAENEYLIMSVFPFVEFTNLRHAKSPKQLSYAVKCVLAHLPLLNYTHWGPHCQE